MIDYSITNLYKNASWSVLYKVISAGLSFITVPLILHCLGTEKYGIWASVLSLASWIYYLDLGIGGGLRNKLTESLAEKDSIKARGYLNAAYLMLGIICTGVFFVGSLVICVFDAGGFLNGALKDENFNFILLATLLFSCINFTASLSNNIFYATQNASQVSLFNLLGQILFIMGLGLYSFLGVSELLWIAILEGSAQLLKNFFETIYAFRRYPFLRFSFSKITSNYSKGILSFGIQLFIMQIAALILNGTDNLIIMKYFGAEDVTAYSLCYKYFGLIQAFFVVIITPLYSAYTAAYTLQDARKIKKILRGSLRIYILFVVGLVISGILFPWFAKLWLQMDLAIPSDMIFLIGVYFVLLMFSHNFSTLVNGIGKITGTTVAVGLEAVLNVPLSIYLAVDCSMGVNGVILGSIAVMCIAVVVYPYIAIKEIRKMEG